MKSVSGLLENLDYQIIKGTREGEITALVYDSRRVTKDCMFVCIKGAVYDSHEHVEEITAKGARVIVAEREVEVPEGVTLVLVADTRYALSLLSAAYFDHPADRLKVIGITGTKGKTTTTFKRSSERRTFRPTTPRRNLTWYRNILHRWWRQAVRSALWRSRPRGS